VSRSPEQPESLPVTNNAIASTALCIKFSRSGLLHFPSSLARDPIFLTNRIFQLAHHIYQRTGISDVSREHDEYETGISRLWAKLPCGDTR
jgi:hypothetical protein